MRHQIVVLDIEYLEDDDAPSDWDWEILLESDVELLASGPTGPVVD